MKFLIPEKLETERLLLRLFKETDWLDLHRLYSNPDVVKYTIMTPYTEFETWQKMAAFTGHWILKGYGPYGIEEKQSGRVIGFAGPYFPLNWPDPEIQWSLSQEFWGKGYASEAVRAIKKTLAECIPATSFISIIHPDNKSSLSLAEKMNTTYEKEWDYKNIVWHIYRHK